MAKDGSTPLKKGKRKSKLIVRLTFPMLLMILLQLVTFFAILVLGGEFSYVEQYAYNAFVEKTETRKNYIENKFQQIMPLVQESAEKLNRLITDLLAEQDASISALQTDKELNQYIMESSVDSLIDLLRRSAVNDVYLILETGNLYGSGSSDSDAKAALYLRNLDTTTDVGYEDLLMEVGLSSISQQFGIILDSGWTVNFAPDPEDTINSDFYYRTMQMAQRNSEREAEELGYWSGFSKLSRGAAASMKYSVPLIAADGTVYGVLGIGLTENTILADLPAGDFISETACYVLGRNKSGGTFDIVTHSGVAFDRFVGTAETLEVSAMRNEDICEFSLPIEVELAGSVQYINLYGHGSPYAAEQWALISIADRASVLRPLTSLIRMLIIAAVVSLVVSVAVVIWSCRKVVKPISAAIKTMNSNQEYNRVVRFEPSNIYELDKMTDAITQLQINVQDFSSQVSRMIRMADMGLGTFMYDRIDDSVFVGQSFLQLLHFPKRDEDVVMSRQVFLNNIIAEETKQAVAESLERVTEKNQEDDTKEYSIVQEDGSTRWMRLSLVHKKNKSIGILQDITDATMERKRIEYERDYDNTTGLLNRHAYYHRIERLFHNTDALKVTAFLMMDLDNLKYVNDTYGHDFGDDYLKAAATTLKKFQNYGGIVSRLSGDEFIVCLPGFSSKDEVRKIIREVRKQIARSYCLLPDGTHFRIRASAGVSWYPDDADSYEMLVKYADFAMYTIKHSTKGGLAEFDSAAYAKDSVLITGVEEMNRIIDERRVRYAFHSIISAKTGEIYGYEALMRPQSTVIQSPLDLLRIAKTGAKLYEIERLTWTKSFADFRAQIDAGRVAKDSRIFINSISNCVLQPADVEVIETEYSDLLSQVVLEILESESMKEEYTARKLRRMQKWNAQIALDDFGTGYNGEYALITVQPNIIKVDHSIISGCDKDLSRRTIINNLVKLARTKQILVLAEGVETEEELETVISCGVDLLQGYYLTHPLYEPQPVAPEIVEKIRSLADAANGIRNEEKVEEKSG